MSKNKFIKTFIFSLFFSFNLILSVNSEIMILKKCKSLHDTFIKNEYILDLERSLMIRNYIYDSRTYKKHRATDLSVKKENSIERFIYKDDDLILTDKIGYPQFYTQLVFKKNSPIINIKTVINNETAISKVSTCNKIETYEKES